MALTEVEHLFIEYRRTGDATIPLSEVRGIRRQTHAILKGSLGGFGGGPPLR